MTEDAAAAPPARRTAVALVAVVAGIVLCVLAHVVATHEGHSYVSGARPPSTVSLSAGSSYAISVHGGLQTEQDRGIDPASLACTLRSGGGASSPLTVTAEQAGTKEINQIGSFVSPVSGTEQVQCSGLGTVFVDDADGASPDYALFLLLLGVVSLAIGGPLLVSAALRGIPSSRAA